MKPWSLFTRAWASASGPAVRVPVSRSHSISLQMRFQRGAASLNARFERGELFSVQLLPAIETQLRRDAETVGKLEVK